MALLAIVILNWNGRPFLERFLPIVESRSKRDDTIIVVADNGSTDSSVAYLKEHHPEVRIIVFDKNHGFTGGYNKALAQVDAEYFLLLNSDVEVTEGWLDPLLEHMQNNRQTGICMPKIRSAYNHSMFEYAGAAGGFIDYLGYPFCRGRILSNIEEDKGQYDNSIEIFWASGAAMMIRSSLYKELGGLDERFFAHMEEIDLCWRAKLLGNQVWVIPQSVVYHVGGGTLPNNSPHKLYLNFRNNLIMLYKNLPLSSITPVIVTRMIMDGAAAAVYLCRFRFSYLKSVFRAHMDFWKILPTLERSKVKVKGVKSGRTRVSGVYKGSIVLKFFLTLRKITYFRIGADIS